MVLIRKSDSSRAVVRIITLACMVLHNICIMQGDSISKKLDLRSDGNDQKRNRKGKNVITDEGFLQDHGCLF